jgi:hypothetical protein
VTARWPTRCARAPGRARTTRRTRACVSAATRSWASRRPTRRRRPGSLEGRDAGRGAGGPYGESGDRAGRRGSAAHPLRRGLDAPGAAHQRGLRRAGHRDLLQARHGLPARRRRSRHAAVARRARAGLLRPGHRGGALRPGGAGRLRAAGEAGQRVLRCQGALPLDHRRQAPDQAASERDARVRGGEVMIEIPIRRRDGSIRAHALVDDEDRDVVHGRSWHLAGKGYVRASSAGGGYLHRILLGLVPGDGLQGDHINGDPLDCRRSNLRVATRSQNMQNRRGAQRTSTSRFRGVSWDRAYQRWKAQASVDGQQRFLGHFDDEAEAGAVAAAWRREHMPFSEDARMVV